MKIDDDCPLINMVYTRSMHKWIWIDPSHDVYVMDENGTLLDLAELRQRIINDQPLLVNPDANLNRKQSALRSEYLFSYMAKNLYTLQCPVESYYNAETAEKGKNTEYVTLLPPGLF